MNVINHLIIIMILISELLFIVLFKFKDNIVGTVAGASAMFLFGFILASYYEKRK